MINTLKGYIDAQLANPHQKFEAVRDEAGFVKEIRPVSKAKQIWYATKMGANASNQISMELSRACVELREKSIYEKQQHGEQPSGWDHLGTQRLTFPLRPGVSPHQRAGKIAEVDLSSVNQSQWNRLRKVEQGMILIDKGLDKPGAAENIDTISVGSTGSGMATGLALARAGNIAALWRMRSDTERSTAHDRSFDSNYVTDPQTWKIVGTQKGALYQTADALAKQLNAPAVNYHALGIENLEQHENHDIEVAEVLHQNAPDGAQYAVVNRNSGGSPKAAAPDVEVSFSAIDEQADYVNVSHKKSPHGSQEVIAIQTEYADVGLKGGAAHADPEERVVYAAIVADGPRTTIKLDLPPLQVVSPREQFLDKEAPAALKKVAALLTGKLGFLEESGTARLNFHRRALEDFHTKLEEYEEKWPIVEANIEAALAHPTERVNDITRAADLRYAEKLRTAKENRTKAPEAPDYATVLFAANMKARNTAAETLTIAWQKAGTIRNQYVKEELDDTVFDNVALQIDNHPKKGSVDHQALILANSLVHTILDVNGELTLKRQLKVANYLTQFHDSTDAYPDSVITKVAVETAQVRLATRPGKEALAKRYPEIFNPIGVPKNQPHPHDDTYTRLQIAVAENPDESNA